MAFLKTLNTLTAAVAECLDRTDAVVSNTQALVSQSERAMVAGDAVNARLWKQLTGVRELLDRVDAKRRSALP